MDEFRKAPQPSHLYLHGGVHLSQWAYYSRKIKDDLKIFPKGAKILSLTTHKRWSCIIVITKRRSYHILKTLSNILSTIQDITSNPQDLPIY